MGSFAYWSVHEAWGWGGDGLFDYDPGLVAGDFAVVFGFAAIMTEENQDVECP